MIRGLERNRGGWVLNRILVFMVLVTLFLGILHTFILKDVSPSTSRTTSQHHQRHRHRPIGG
jgi:hypothetical protein